MKNKEYSVDFKVEAVKYLESDNTITLKRASEKLGVAASTLSKWKTQYHAGVFSDEKRPKYDAKDEEIRRLTKELKQSQMEVEILKKATAFFAKEK